MKSFQQFVNEAKEVHDREGLGGGTGMTHRTQTGKIGSERKKSELTTQLKQHKGQKKRVKAVGGGKTVDSVYKKRKDAGKQRPKSSREQQPTQQRGTAGVKGKEAQKKAYKERKAREKGAKTKTATQLLSKGNKSETDPNNPKYKPDPKYKRQKASGYTAHERRKIRRAGERLVRDIQQKKEKPISHYDPKL